MVRCARQGTGVSRNPQKKLDAGLKNAGMTSGEMDMMFRGIVLSAVGSFTPRQEPMQHGPIRKTACRL